MILWFFMKKIRSWFNLFIDLITPKPNTDLAQIPRLNLQEVNDKDPAVYLIKAQNFPYLSQQ